MQEKEFLSVPETAALLGVKDETAYEWARRGVLPAVRIQRTLRVRRSDLDEMFDKARVS